MMLARNCITELRSKYEKKEQIRFVMDIESGLYPKSSTFMASSLGDMGQFPVSTVIMMGGYVMSCDVV